MRPLASLTNRIFLASSVLAVLSIAVAVFVINARVTREAEDSVRRGLEETAALLGDWQSTLSDNFQLATRLVADSPKLKAAIDTGDPQTVEPLAREFQRETKGDVLIITHRSGRVLARLGPWTEDPPRGEDDVGTPAAVTYWPHPDGVLQLVTVPVLVGSQVLGGVSVGFLFDRARASQLRHMTESEIAFAVGGRVVAGTVDARHFPTLEQALRDKRQWARVAIGDDDYVVSVRPFEGRADGGEASAIVFQSRTERLRFLREIHLALSVTAILAVLGAVGLGYLVARTVTRPLAAITAAMREIARTGDLTRKVTLPAGNWEDEDARLLARTFNTLTDSIATFQREAAQKERLSSLGRLSTIIAHEIRNPLMIIKASLRTLRRDPLEPSDVREAAGDIGEEVERLNGIVTGVLDFARPVRIDVAPTDLRSVCEQSIAAATADRADPDVALVADEGLPALVTDGERLRGVLVNLVTNARQAVVARRDREAGVAAESPGTAVPPGSGLVEGTDDGQKVTVRLRRAGERRVAVEVIDRGAGIPPDEMKHLFEPYFTTKREGTGLGLAIARNVIEALGGTIQVESSVGVGTRVKIELGDAPPRDT